MAGRRRMLVVVALAATATGCGAPSSDQEVPVTVPTSITVTSAAFAQGEAIPRDYTCDGAGRIPSLAWSDVPDDAGALALVVDDPDAPSGTFTHWVVLDLPVDTRELTDGRLPAGTPQAVNSSGRTGWYPPCPPSGRHRYRFPVQALTRATGVPDGAPLERALAAIRGFAVASGTLEGTYSR
ncbi:MAG TPA: YbhB/YbcL family Raf kinase inhibitor-like protein [Intrasporangium sp.]|nr:YbhB/YbcL family Raf kinase inhibitor-like protein [Intrasporangium sp.]